MKQDKERIEKELNSKYRDSGRRNYIDNIKNQVLWKLEYFIPF